MSKSYENYIQDELFATMQRTSPEEMKAAVSEYKPSQGDLVTFPGTNGQVYQIVRVTADGNVIYKLLDGHYSDSLRNLRRIGMEAL